jgi:hypothetical protein
VLHERHAQQSRVLRREDKRQPAMFGMVHLENAAVFAPRRSGDRALLEPPSRERKMRRCVSPSPRSAFSFAGSRPSGDDPWRTKETVDVIREAQTRLTGLFN